ncbi:MAG: DUF7507 domain-containing protein [Phycicoccus sp.]
MPGASMSCSVTTQYTITQADVDAGVVTNTATASGEDSTGATVTSPTASTSVPVEQTSTLSLAKTAAASDVNGNGVTDLGDRIGWSFVVRNTGTVTLSLMAVEDPRAGTVTCPVTTLAPGAQTTCTAAAYTVTQADVDAGVVSNTAAASAQAPNSIGVRSNASATDTPVTQVDGLALVKTGTATDVDGNGTDVGDPVTYSFRVTNSGTVTVTTLAIVDARVGAVSCPVTTLAPGAETTCTATGSVTQADVDAGVSTNTAQAQGENPAGSTVVSNSSTSSIPVPQTSELSLAKTAAVTDVDGNGTDLGDTVRWTFTVTNSGTTTMTSVVVSDPLAGSVTCAATSLAPGASTTCTSDGGYAVSQADVDAGQVVNTATASGSDPSGTTVTSPSASSTTPVPQASTLALTKSAAVTDVNGTGVTDLGDRIAWSFVVRNTGTVTLSSVGVTDPRAGVVTCPVTTLAPGVQTTCTAAPYAVTQADVDAGVVSNTATSTAQPPGGAAVTSNTSATDTPVAQASSLSLTKSATRVDVNGDGLFNTADRITWSFTVRNTGTTTISALTITDPRAGAVTCPVTTLAPGAQTTCTAAPYVITSSDVETGSVTNTATARGTGPGGATVTSAPSSVTTPVDQGPAMTVTKNAAVTDVNGNGVTDLGDRIAYTFTVRNVGNVSLNTLTINDPRAGPVTCAATTLALNASTTCTANSPYVITQANVDAGVANNTAQGRARSPLNAVVIAPNASTSTPVTQTSGMTLTKSAALTDVNGTGVTDLGDRIGWSFVVRNSGTVTLSSVAVEDPRAGTVTCPVTTLAPGAQTTCTAAAYTVTQADVDAGVVSNSATSSARTPGGATVTSNTSATDTPVSQAPALELVKTAAVTDLDGNGTDLGDTIQWTFTVTNSGTTTMTSVAVNDPLAGTVTCAATSLTPGASTTCTSDGAYTITQPNVEAGQVVNTATASGRDPLGATVTSPSASATTPIPRISRLALVKSVASVSDPNGNGRVDDGEVVTYSFAVTNTGTVAVNALTINDSAVTGLSCPVTTLAPGASTTCTATRVINGANIDVGSVSNTATASGTSSAGPVTSPTSSVTLPISRQSVLTLVKSAAPPVDANGNGRVDAGDTIQYSIRVRNSGNTSLNDIVVTDPRLPSLTCPLSFLQAGGEMNCTSPPYVIIQAEVDAGAANNTAAATATSPTGPLSETSSTSTPLPQQSRLAITKGATVADVNTNGVNDIGDRITWTFTVSNPGTVTVTNISIEDTNVVGAITCASTTLAPGATTTCAADTPYTIATRDAVLGSIINVARAIGESPGGGTVFSPRDQVVVPVEVIPAWVFTKTAVITDVNGNGATDLGDTITWSFEVLYRGIWRLDFAITDPRAGTITCPTNSLSPDESTTCTAAPYTVTQADVDAGVVPNTATIAGDEVGDIIVPFSATSSTDSAVAQRPALSLAKSVESTDDVDGDGRIGVGDTIRYSFAVTNTGTVTVGNLTVADSLISPADIDCTGPIAPGAIGTCSGSHTVTQAEVDAGVVSNTATSSGTDPDGDPVTSPPDTVDYALEQEPLLALTKTATADDGGDGSLDVGDTIAYSFLITNTGNVTVTALAIADPILDQVSCPVTTLAPGVSTTCTTDDANPYVVTQPDVDAGLVANTATATGEDPSGAAVTSPPSSTATPVDQLVGLVGGKSGAVTDVNGNGVTDLGDTIEWSFELTNTGSVTVTGVTVGDPKAGPVSCPVSTLAPGASTTCTADEPYVVTQGDVDAGLVSNSASASGVAGGEPFATPEFDANIPVWQRAELSLAKSAVVNDLDGNGTDLGDTVDWSFDLVNRGTVTLDPVLVDDPTAGETTCGTAVLAPGAATTCTASPYTITQADVDNGVVANTAVASGEDLLGNTTFSDQSSTATPIGQDPGLAVTKSASPTDVDGDGRIALGDTVDYAFEVSNTGNVSLTSVELQDFRLAPITVSCPRTTLGPGEAMTCRSDQPYVVNAADVNRGVLQNTAQAFGRDPAGSATQSTLAEADVPIAQAPQITLVKTAAVTDVNGNGLTDLGDTIAWTFEATNTGDTDLGQLSGVDDPLAGPVSCRGRGFFRGQTRLCTADNPYVITQADVDAGVVSNVAVAFTDRGNGEVVRSNRASADTPIDQVNTVEMVKTGEATDVDGDGLIAAGDGIRWSFELTNTGTTTATDIAVTDPRAGPVTCPVTTLAPGASTTCTADDAYVITQADVDSGFVVNAASGTFEAGGQPGTIPEVESTVAPDLRPGLAVAKQGVVGNADGDGVTDLGDPVTYSFVVTNTGNVTITSVAVSDPLAGAVTCPSTSLAPGASTTCTADDAYVVTQADVDAGVVSNTATASGTGPFGIPSTSDPSTSDIPVAQAAGMALTKSATVTDVNGNGGTDVGDRIAYAFTVRDTGTVSLDTVTVSDPLAGPVTCAATTLAPGAQTTCTATTPYVITAADAAAGVVANTATAAARDPQGDVVGSAPSSTTTTVVRPSLNLTKAAMSTSKVGFDGKYRVGYRIEVTNSGPVAGSYGPITDTPSFAANLPVLGASWGGQVTGSATGAGPFTIGAANTPIAAGATHTYLVTIDYFYADQVPIFGCGGPGTAVYNRADLPAGQESGPATDNAGCITPPSPPSPNVFLVKSAGPVQDLDGNGPDVGDTVTYGFTVRNTGNVDLTAVTLTDPKLSGSPIPCPTSTLPGGGLPAVTCSSATYTLTQADVDAGSVTNLASVTGGAPNGTRASDTSGASTPIPSNRSLALTKTAAVTDVNGNAFTDQGDRIAWSFLVRNTGAVTLTSVGVGDPRAGTVTCPVTTLAPGVQTTCTAAAYTISQADVDAGVVANTAAAAGRDPQGGTVTSPSSTTNTPVNQASGVDVQKTGVLSDLDGNGPELGDRVTWTVVVRNIGTTTITGVAVTDIGAGPPSCPSTTLAGGASMVCTVPPYTVDVDDMDGGSATNIAEVRASSPQGPLFDSVTAFVRVDPVKSVSLSKSAAVTDVDGDGRTGVGDQVRWSFVVTNTGNTSIYGGTISDPLAGAVSCERDDLPWFQVRWLPGESFTCTADAPYTVSRADAVAGVLTNTAVANVFDAGEEPLSSAPATTDTPVTQQPGLSLVKRAAPDDGGDGRLELLDTVTYTFEVTNTGTATVTGLAIDDPLVTRLGPISCPVTTLPSGASTTCTGSITVSQSDVDAGEIRNTATANGSAPGGIPVESDPSSVVTPVDQVDGILLTKAAELDDLDGNGPDAGDRIRWSFTATNTGTTTLDEVVIDDPLAGRVSCVADRPDEAFSLDPGETRSDCFAEQPYTITQADVDAGLVENTATASSPTRDGGTVTSDPASTLTPFPRDGALALTKTATVVDDGDGVTEVGDVIRWTFEVTNTGVTTATGVAVEDPFGGPVTCDTTTLAPGASTTCTAEEFLIAQSDVDRGVVSNTAVARATTAGVDVLSAPASTDTPVAQQPGIEVVKSATVEDVNGNGVTDLGDQIRFDFGVTNTGTTTLIGVVVEDPLAGEVTCPSPILGAGIVNPTARQRPTSMRCVATTPYAITQADVEAGVVTNTAVARAVSAGVGGPAVTSEPSTVETPVVQAPSLALTKTATPTDVNGDGAIDSADTVDFAFEVTNTGTVTVTGIAVDDPVAGTVTCPSTTLAPGASVTCRADQPYVPTLTEMDAGVVTNTATATGTGPGGVSVRSAPSSTETLLDQRPELSLTKQAEVTDVDGDGAVGLGDTITWTFSILNTGNVSLARVVVDDPLAGTADCTTETGSPGPTVIDPDQRWSCVATSPYEITQADVDAGVVTNTATVRALTGGDLPVVSNPSSTDTVIGSTAALTLTKAATVADDGDGAIGVGDVIRWTFEVVGAGTATVTDLVVDDPSAGAVTCAATTLAPGAATTCAADAEYTITQADVDAGEVVNVATASGSSRGVPVTSFAATTTTEIPRRPALTLAKSASVTDTNGNDRTDAGDEIVWSFVIRNTGNVTLRDVSIDDPRVTDVDCVSDRQSVPGAIPTLDVASSWTCTATSPYVITPADVDAGVVTNTATVGGRAPDGVPVTSSPATAETTVDQTRRLALAKRAVTRDANGDGRITDGDIVTWAFTVANEGTVTVRDVEVADPMAGPVTCTDTTLAPGESTTCRTDRERPITAAEASAGQIRNVATASAGDSGGTVVSSAEAEAEVVVSESAPPSTSPPSGSPTPTRTPASPPRDGPPGPFGPLASTGATGLGVLVGGGTAALLLGAWLVVVSRRRRADGARP